MKKFLIIAAIINLAVAMIHTIIGERDIVAPLLATDAPDTVRWTLHSAWHMISVVLFVSSFTLFYLTGRKKTTQIQKFSQPISVFNTLIWQWYLSLQVRCMEFSFRKSLCLHQLEYQLFWQVEQPVNHNNGTVVFKRIHSRN